MDLTKVLADTLLGDQSISALSKSSGANKKQVQQVLINGLPT